MIDLAVPDVAIGALALATAILYAALHEYAAKNHRDAKLLGAVGLASLMGGVVAWI